jgi:alkylated DNA repair dioxygenase AlkB
MTLFGPDPRLPSGLRYQDDLITPMEETELAGWMETLPLKPFEFHGHLGNRRTVSFGWRYDYARSQALPTDAIPEALHPLRAKVAAFAGRHPDDLVQALVTEYAPGAGIGWHRDKPQFGQVVGVSLLAPCVFRLRRKAGSRWDRAAFTADPRSAYLLDGAARWDWEHSITPMDRLRFSVTFRTLA